MSLIDTKIKRVVVAAAVPLIYSLFLYILFSGGIFHDGSYKDMIGGLFVLPALLPGLVLFYVAAKGCPFCYTSVINLVIPALVFAFWFLVIYSILSIIVRRRAKRLGQSI